MNMMFNSRWSLWAIIILIVLNIVLLGTVWYFHLNRSGPPPMQKPGLKPDEFFARELGLSDGQIRTLNTLRDEHMRRGDSLRALIFGLNNRMLDEFFAPSPDSAVIKALADSVGVLHARLEMSLIEHVSDLQNFCTPEQQEKLKQLIIDIFQKARMQGPPPEGSPGDDRRMPPPDGGPGEGGRMPPPPR